LNIIKFLVSYCIEIEKIIKIETNKTCFFNLSNFKMIKKKHSKIILKIYLFLFLGLYPFNQVYFYHIYIYNTKCDQNNIFKHGNKFSWFELGTSWKKIY